MKAVIQRAAYAQVTVDGETVGRIGKGFLVLLGAAQGDTKKEAELLARKIANLRVFQDAEGKMNLSPLQIGAEVLVVSQFTLCADLRKGNRPSFIYAAAPDTAEGLYLYFCDCLRREGISNVPTGVFGAHMDVTLCNDGPVTICMDTSLWIG
ncbi:MAG: D-tyrosyl-tRNA(Tyr) deacylase [Oscillospiraceae bacterium]|jgi:D-tyrosyl-tRNA(Tyr) deacylase|nr:D-tyrosyl-tRNA(Tyr) deacylase [Oscillospiraceae bacterium]